MEHHVTRRVQSSHPTGGGPEPSPRAIAACGPHRRPSCERPPPRRSAPYRPEPPSRRPRPPPGRRGLARSRVPSRRDAARRGAPLTARGGGHAGGEGRCDHARRGRTAGATGGALGRGACPRSRCRSGSRHPARCAADPAVRAGRRADHGGDQARRAPLQGGRAGCAARSRERRGARPRSAGGGRLARLGDGTDAIAGQSPGAA